MAAIDLFKLPVEEKKLIFASTAVKIGLPPYAVEKDWWLVQTLDIIFQMKVGKQLLFKGGTSLSKAWNLIDRFSEDIDLALNREYLGFDSGLISKTQVRKLRTASFDYLTRSFCPGLEASFKEAGIKDLKFEHENIGDGDQDPVSILIFYPNVIDYPIYIEPKIKVEIGSRSLKDPFSDRSFSSMVGQTFSEKFYADPSITIPCINPERTYLEKLFLLHEEFKKPKGKIRVDRLSRHLYDIYKIARSDYKVLALNDKLIKTIIAHRERFNGIKGIDYSTHFPPNLNPIPPTEIIKAWETDYKKMQEEMIPGDSPSFEKLMKVINTEVAIYNALNIEADGK